MTKNSKTLSSERSSEDLDLLERSTKKSKHVVGGLASAMEIADKSEDTAEMDTQETVVPVQNLDSETDMVTVVAETPQDEQGTVPLNNPDWVAEDGTTTIPVTGEGIHPLETTPVEPGHGDGTMAPQSYLDYVESCPTCHKEADKDDEVPLVTLNGGDPGVDQQQRGTGPGGGSTAKGYGNSKEHEVGNSRS
nr:hypothetical protein Iba_chr09eCG13940 [Ipomoea batatas]